MVYRVTYYSKEDSYSEYKSINCREKKYYNEESYVFIDIFSPEVIQKYGYNDLKSQ